MLTKNKLKLLILVLLLTVPQFSHAAVWSACVKIIGVADYIAYNNAVLLVTSPQITTCTTDPLYRPNIVIGQVGITATNINAQLALATAAYLSGHQVQLYMDGTAACNVQIVAIGGDNGNCP